MKGLTLTQRFKVVSRTQRRKSQTVDYFKISEWKTCQTAVDLALLVDSSGSISKTNYKKLKAFIIYIVRSFGVSYKGSHVSLILYSNSATVKAGFGQFYSTEAFVYMVRSLPHEKGQTRIDKALTRAGAPGASWLPHRSRLEFTN